MPKINLISSWLTRKMLLYSIYLMITGNKASTIPPIPIPGIGCSRFWFWGLGIEMFSNKIDKVVYLGTRLNCTTPIDYVLWRNWIYVNLYCEKSLTFYSASGLNLTYLNTLLWHASTHLDFLWKDLVLLSIPIPIPRLGYRDPGSKIVVSLQL